MNYRIWVAGGPFFTFPFEGGWKGREFEIVTGSTCVDCRCAIPPRPRVEVVHAFTKAGKHRGELCAACIAKAELLEKRIGERHRSYAAYPERARARALHE